MTRRLVSIAVLPAFAVWIVLFTTSIASADLATWQVKGQITSVAPELAGGGISPGDILLSSITYDPAIAPGIDLSYVRAYFSIQHMTVDVGTFHYDGDGGSNGQIDLYGDVGQPPGVVVIDGNPLAGMLINGIGGIEFKVQLDSPTGPAMTPTLTEQPPNLSLFNGRGFNLFAGGAYSIAGVVTSIPEPSAALCLILLAPALARRR